MNRIPGFSADLSLGSGAGAYTGTANPRSGGPIQPALALGSRLRCIQNCLATCDPTSTFSGDCESNCACSCGFWQACGDVPPPGGFKRSFGI